MNICVIVWRKTQQSKLSGRRIMTIDYFTHCRINQILFILQPCGWIKWQWMGAWNCTEFGFITQNWM